MPAGVPGIHHVTAITRDVQSNVDFYVGVLGLRFIKKTVNFDVPDTYHLYFADWLGTPGTAMTFFGWPHLRSKPPGSGQVTVVSFSIPPVSLDFWAGRLRELGVETVRGSRYETDLISLRDPDGIRLELIGEASDQHWVPWPAGPVDPVRQIRGFHSVGLVVREEEPTVRFLIDTMGFRETGRDGQSLLLETGAGGPRARLEVLVDSHAPVGEEATGTVHHVAWRATDDGHQEAWREALVSSGHEVTPVIERKYFRSVYFREPGGVLFEIATDQPGFTVDEEPAKLGCALQLPPQYEGRRETLKFNLRPIVVPTTAASRAGR